MSMGFDPLFLNNTVASLDNISSLTEQLTNEMSSGRRVNSLSDDPVAAGQNVLFNAQLNLIDSFSQTSSSTTGMLQVTDSTLGSVVSQLTQALSLATHGNTGTLSPSDVQSIASQLTGIRDEVLALANTTYLGQHIFSGSQGGTTPFSLDTTTTPPTVVYSGDSGPGAISFVTTPNGQKIQTNLPGNQIFSNAADPTNPAQNVLQTLTNLIADFSSGTPSATAAADTTALQGALSFVSQQRVVIDNSITQLQTAQTFAQSQGTQITAAQTNLMQADIAQLSTQMSTAEVQQDALTQVINLLEKNNGALFSLL